MKGHSCIRWTGPALVHRRKLQFANGTAVDYVYEGHSCLFDSQSLSFFSAGSILCPPDTLYV